MSAVVVHDEQDQSIRRIKVAGVTRGELVYNGRGVALLHTGRVSCSSSTLRAIADLLDSVEVVR